MQKLQNILCVCVFSFAARQFTVRLGDIDLSTDREASAPVTFKVTEVRAHPRFSRVGFYNDIAVLVLDRPVRKSKYVIPVCLPQPNMLPTKERLAGLLSHNFRFAIPLKMKLNHLIFVQDVELVWLGGVQHTMVAKSRQFNVRPNYRFGVMKIVIEHTINQLPIISFVLDTVRAVWMHAKEIQVCVFNDRNQLIETNL